MHYDTVGYVDTRFKCQYYWGITMVQRHIYLIMIAEFLTVRLCMGAFCVQVVGFRLAEQ